MNERERLVEKYREVLARDMRIMKELAEVRRELAQARMDIAVYDAKNSNSGVHDPSPGTTVHEAVDVAIAAGKKYINFNNVVFPTSEGVDGYWDRLGK